MNLTPFLGKPLSPCLLFVAFVTFTTIFSGHNLIYILKQQFDHTQQEVEQPKQQHPRSEKEKDVTLPSSGGEIGGGCNIFEGRWVFGKESRPLYDEGECPYIQPQLTCQAYGRPDKEYQQRRWQPHSCSLPSFNATSMWESLRGKRMMFVGDSLNRNQFASLICLLHSVIPESAKSMQTVNSIIVFRAEEYNATIEFYWAPFLVESNADNAVVHRIQDRIVRIGSIKKHAQHWKGVDILVFNTYLWWLTGFKMKILRGSFKDKKLDIIEMETEEAYHMALKKMVKWVEKNVDPQKSRVFFVTMSPSHSMSIDWGGEAGGNCFNQTTPIEDPRYWGSSSSKSMMVVIGKVLSNTKVPITLLNITQLSEYRKDAHSSIYKKQWSPLTSQQLANPVSYADCIHWCLPGLPDTWNELLYTKLLFP
ncbi:hypothetical protein MRB53_003911 [Persea americana]|uniref:Uncharacterized protein n=1 Tax=Persea americana TaxID=3435 RepID=A0ACC2MZ17_PERAE|nr:hypothetical protein MRB53_003911 [Persea americana]